MNLAGADILILAGADIGNLVHADHWESGGCHWIVVGADRWSARPPARQSPDRPGEPTGRGHHATP